MSIRRTIGLVPVLFAAIAIAPSADAPAQVAEEPQQIDERQVRVRSHKELSITPRGADEADVLTRELWYAAFDGKAWGEWQKHGIVFQREQTVTWSPNEGHW